MRHTVPIFGPGEAKMPFKTEQPVYLNKRLCSVEIFTPTQIVHPDKQFDFLASAWFGVVREEIPTADGPRSLTFGLHAAMLTVETCDDSQMRREGRYQSQPLTLVYESLRDEIKERQREASGGGGFSVPLLNFFKAEGSAKVSAANNATDAEKRHQNTTFDVYEVETTSPDEWTIQAINPARPAPYLKGGELKEVTLCTIDSPIGRAEVTASISFAARDLWLDVSAGAGRAPMEDEANQNAVLGVLVAKASEQNRADVLCEDTNEERLTIAQSTLRRVQDGGGS
ncbi:MAG: hypothetical protein ACPGGK_17405 [Pikeienuella sp.]